MRSGFALLVFCLAAAPAGQAAPQAAPAALQFDVASVKPTPVNVQGLPLSGMAHESFRDNHADLSCTLRMAIGEAYDVQAYQVEYLKEFNPILRSFYDIVGKPAGPATEDQLRAMLRALLADRFKLAVQTETRSVPGYALVVAKGGPINLKPVSPDAPDAHGMTFAQFATALLHVNEQGFWVGPNITGALPVEDATGLAGTYDLWPGPFGHAGFSPAARPDPREPGTEPEPLAALLYEKLRLTLVKQRISQEYITVTHIERPTPD